MIKQSAFLLLIALSLFAGEKITPFKYKDTPDPYKVPLSAKHFLPREGEDSSDLLYYYSPLDECDFYPITILCTGSSTRKNIATAIAIHRYFIEEIHALGSSLLTVEQYGVSDLKTDADLFMKHYTRTSRLRDHRIVIDHLISNPPSGWNGKFIFIGVSEGGSLVTSLSEEYSELAIATINWSGAGDLPWKNELWNFISHLKNTSPPVYLLSKLPTFFTSYFGVYIPDTIENFESIISDIEKDPSFEKEFMGMTYAYHYDALFYPKPLYEKITTPYLVVTGALDPCIESSDAFVKKLSQTNPYLTYIRVKDMDHSIRQRSDILQKSFEWLEDILSQ